VSQPTKPEPKPEESKAKAKDLAPAGQSGDPTVHKLLAERQGHLLALTPDPDYQARRDAAQAAIDEIDKSLADLGFSAK
jgi:hypothetical protein